MPRRISAPAAAKDFAIAQPYPLSSATPAINALLPMNRFLHVCSILSAVLGLYETNNLKYSTYIFTIRFPLSMQTRIMFTLQEFKDNQTQNLPA